MLLLCYLLLGPSLTSATEPIPRTGSLKTDTSCYGQDHSVVCPSGSHIGIASFNYGFKAAAKNCPLDGTARNKCCEYDPKGDCLQTDPEESRYLDALSGKSDGVISTSTVKATSGGACDNVSFSFTSVFSKIDYICIPGERMGHMCTDISINTTNGDPVYLHNRNYPSSGILNTDMECDCSVEALGIEPVQVFILHMDLYDTPEDCRQSLTLTDRDGSVLMEFQCKNYKYNIIETTVLNTSYAQIKMQNNNTVTNAGKFLLAFQVMNISTPLLLRCSSLQPIRGTANQTQQPVITCDNLTDPANGKVQAPNTSYGAMATYRCNQGYIQSGGDVKRTCQVNKTWSGAELLCTKGCSNLTNPNNGGVNVTFTSAGGVATYVCNPGFEMSSTNRTRVCQKDGTWSGMERTCNSKTVFAPDDTNVDTISLGAVIGIIVAVIGVVAILIGVAYESGFWKRAKKYVVNKRNRYMAKSTAQSRRYYRY